MSSTVKHVRNIAIVFALAAIVAVVPGGGTATTVSPTQRTAWPTCSGTAQSGIVKLAVKARPAGSASGSRSSRLAGKRWRLPCSWTTSSASLAGPASAPSQ